MSLCLLVCHKQRAGIGWHAMMCFKEKGVYSLCFMRHQLAMLFSVCADGKGWGGEGEAGFVSSELILVLTFSWYICMKVLQMLRKGHCKR